MKKLRGLSPHGRVNPVRAILNLFISEVASRIYKSSKLRCAAFMIIDTSWYQELVQIKHRVQLESLGEGGCARVADGVAAQLQLVQHRIDLDGLGECGDA